MNLIFTHIKSKLDKISSIEGIVRNKIDNTIQIDNNEKNYYEDLMKKMKDIINSENIYINMSTDRAISASTLSAINKYIDDKYKVIYIDSTPDLNRSRAYIFSPEEICFIRPVFSATFSSGSCIVTNLLPFNLITSGAAEPEPARF